VPGIDVIMGSHSHYRGELRTIEGTRTAYVSPYQYLAYLSEVRLHFRGGKLERVTGGLVKMDARQPEDAQVAATVADLQRKLEAKRPERFEVLGRVPRALSDVGISEGPAPIGTWATEAVRRAVGAHACFMTASSFRAGLAEGEVRVEDFHAAIPYPNRVALAEMTGAQLAEWVALSESKRGSDGYSQQSGVRYTVEGGRVSGLQVLKDPANPETGWEPVDAARTYTVATVDFQAWVAAGYREAFAKAGNPRRTEVDLHRTLIAALKTAR
jgi:5'-nucleotidase